MTGTVEEINAIAVQERKATSLGETLYQIEDDLLALVETEGMVPEEREAEFQAVLYEQLRKAVTKRDRVGQFIRHCELMADNSKAEEKRLKERREMYEKASEKMREYVRKVIESLGRDEKGKFQKLEGKTVTLSLRNNPQQVKVLDESQIPEEYRRITVTLPLDVWRDLIHTAEPEEELMKEISKCLSDRDPRMDISKTAIKKALEDGEEVPGADLESSTSLVIR